MGFLIDAVVHRANDRALFRQHAGRRADALQQMIIWLSIIVHTYPSADFMQVCR